MLKRIIYITILMLLLLPTTLAWAVPADGTDKQGNELNMTEVYSYIDDLDNEIKSVIPDIDFKGLVYGFVKGEIDFKPQEIVTTSLSYVFKEVVANFSILGKLVILAIVCAVLQNLSNAMGQNSTGQLSHMVAYLVLITLAIGSFTVAVQAGREMVDKLVVLMQAILPLLLTLLVAVGGITTAAIFQPVVFVSIALVGTIVRNIILPLVLFSAILGLISYLSPKFKVTNLASLIKTVSMGFLGILTTIFLGILSIQGVAGAVGDSVVLRTAKFATDTFVPVVGSMFSEAMEAIVSSSLLIKNAVGLAGAIVIFTIMLMPLLKIFCVAIIYKLAGAMIQPIENGQMSGCLNDLGNSLLMVFAVVATTGLLFFFTMAIIVAVGNFTVMLR